MDRRVSAVVLVASVFGSPALAGVAYEPSPGNMGTQFKEGFQGMSTGFEFGYVLPSGMGTLVGNNGQRNMLNAPGWNFKSLLMPFEGSHFQGDAGCNGYTFTFPSPTNGFGAYFGTNSDGAGGTAELFDQSGVSLGIFPIQGPLAGWAWDGWYGTSGTLFSKVKITPGNTWGGFLMVDAAATGHVPAPGAAGLLVLGAASLIRRRR